MTSETQTPTDIVRNALAVFERITARGRAAAASTSICESCMAYGHECDGAAPGESVADCFEAPENTDADFDAEIDPLSLSRRQSPIVNEPRRVSLHPAAPGRIDSPASGDRAPELSTADTGSAAGPPPTCGARSFFESREKKTNADRVLTHSVDQGRIGSPAAIGRAPVHSAEARPSAQRPPRGRCVGAGVFSELAVFFHTLILRSC